MLNNYAESGGGFNGNHGQTTRPVETSAKQHNISTSWGTYNSQLEGMYCGTEQSMYMAPYDSTGKHTNYPQYPHQPVPTPVVKCQEACCQHFDRYPINPAPLRYQPSQPRYDDSRQYFTDRRAMQPTLSRKKAYPADSAFAGIPDRHYSQFMGRGQFLPDSRQQMQMMRSQYPMYPTYWGSTRGYSTRMNYPPPPYHQSVSQGAQLQAGLKMTDAHYMEPTQKSLGTQRHRTVGPSAGSEIIRPVPEPKRSTLDPNLQSCYEFGYAGGFVPFGEVNKIPGAGITQNGSSCKIPSDKQFHAHQMQYSMQASDRTMMNCSNPINDLSYSMNFPPIPGSDPYIRSGLDDGQSLTDSRKSNIQYDSSLGKKRPDLDLRQYLATWEDDEEEGTRLSEPVTLGNSGAPYIVVDCRSLEGETAQKIQERFKTPSQNSNSKSRGSSPSSDGKRSDEQTRTGENTEKSNLPSEFQNPTSFAPSMPNLLSENDKGVNFWNGTEREGEVNSAKGSAFQPLDCSKRDNNIDANKRDPPVQIEIPASKAPSNNQSGNISFDNLVSYYGDTRRTTDGGYDFVEMTERLVNSSDKSAVSNHQIPPSMTRPCDPRLQQSHMGNNPSIYNKVTPRYSTGNFQHFKPPMPPDSYYNFKHPMNPNKFFGYENSQVIDPNFEYHKIASDFDPSRMYSNKDSTKDPRRLFHHELDKTVEGAFLDPIRKAQFNDCYQDKVTGEFANADPGQFIPPIIVKKSDLNRDKLYPDKISSVRERVDVLNENQNLPEKTVLITSQNGPPEIFRVAYSPEKDISIKDNVVTLHSGDQTKNNTMTVEVPYVQQYSTLVKLSEEISRAENVEGKDKSKLDDSNTNSKLTNEETKKPTSFKLKRLPNSKEWAVENKGFSESKRVAPENDTVDSDNNPSCKVVDERDVLKPPTMSSNLNMPSLDDFREDENCDTKAENLSKNKSADTPVCAGKNCSTSIDDSNKTNNKFNSQLPQMAIVQPMKMNKCGSSKLESDHTKLPTKNCMDTQGNKPIDSVDGSNPNHISFDHGKLISSPTSHLELIPHDEISKHENFRAHKKIQSFSNRIPNCLPSPSEEFLHSQELAAESQKGSFSPFHVYSDCDDFFKMDERNSSSEKILDTRMPSSPGVEGMFEDINHSNPNNNYEPKSCDFPDLTDHSINSHGSHFQSFSTIFPEESEKRERCDGSVLQMNDKKTVKNLLDGINNQELQNSNKSFENNISDDSKKSTPIPPISLKLKLNESKKMWCIANSNQHPSNQTGARPNDLSVDNRNSTHESLDMDAASELEKDLAQAIDEEKRKSSKSYFGGVQNYSEINQLLSSGTHESVTLQNEESESNIVTGQIYSEQNTTGYPNTSKKGKEYSENKCLTVAKYCRREKIFEKVSLFRKLQNQSSDTLVFDEFGTHFPEVRKDAQSNAKSIAKGIIEDLISNLNTEKPLTGKNNIAHIAPFWGSSFTTDKNESTKNCVPDLHTSHTGIKSENLPVFKGNEEKENSIVKTTEMFINIEKKYYHHHSVIKTVPSVNNIVAKLKRPARSIFSPMSDNGKEDDEPLEGVCDKELHQAVPSQEENSNFEDLKFSNTQSQVECIDEEADNEVQFMDVDQFDQCKTTKSSVSGNLQGEGSLTNELELSQSEKCEGSCNGKLHINENHVVERNGSEIDDALELMGLSNSKSLDTISGSTKHSSTSKDMEGFSFSFLQESSETETGNEEEMGFEENDPHSLIMKQSSQSWGEVDISNQKVSSLQTESLAQNEKSDVQGTLSVTTKEDSKNKTDNFENKAVSLSLEKRCMDSDLSGSSRQLFESNQILLSKTNQKDTDENNGLLNQSTFCRFSNDESESENISEESIGTAASTLLVNNGEYLPLYSNKLRGSDENKTCETQINGETQVNENESRLETSVIVMNKTFNKVSSRKGCFNLESISSNKESLHNVRNIINDVINDAISRDVNLNQDCMKNSLLTPTNLDLTENSYSKSNEQENLKSTQNNYEKAITEFSFSEMKDHRTLDTTYPVLIMEEPQHLSDESTAVKQNMLPLDLTTQVDVRKGSSNQVSYCVSESLCLSQEENLFFVSSGFSYYNEFKKLKWLRFNKSFSNKYCSKITDNVTCEDEKYFCISKQQIFTLPMDVVEVSDCAMDKESSESRTELNTNMSFSDEDNSDDKIDDSTKLKDKTLKSGIETHNENHIHDSFIPLKEKDHFFNKKEVHCLLRRDSLKVLEREAVLREIFSPDPETDNSESKENECPGNFDDQKVEKNLDVPNVLFSFKNDSESQCISHNINEESPNHKISCHSNMNEKTNVESKFEEVTYSSTESFIVHNETSTEKTCYQEPECHNAFSEPESKSVNCSVIEGEVKGLPPSYSPQQSSQDFFVHPSQHQLTTVVTTTVTIDKEMPELPDVGETVKKGITLSQTTNSNNDNSRSLLPEEDSLLCQDKEIILTDQPELSNETSENCENINKTTISFCHDSNTIDISSKIVQNEDANDVSLVTGKDVLFSTTQTSDDQDDEAFNTSLHLKETSDKDISYEEYERDDANITSCQNDKINSVHDSLRNNQHMNKETFPLQCLVEAALALEHVDSKQILLNNSNFPGLYSQPDEGFVESPLSDSSSHEAQEYSVKCNRTDIILENAQKRINLQNDLNVSSKETFPKFEETNYNLRASTRIVTSSSSNIIPYSKRKYGLKSAKSHNTSSESKQKKETLVSDKIKSKKRKSVFAYPRTKKRRKNMKDKQKLDVSIREPLIQNSIETPIDTVNHGQTNDKFEKSSALVNHSEEIEPCLSKNADSTNYSNPCSHFKSNTYSTEASASFEEDEPKNNFGGPLLTGGENTSSQGNIFCVHVDSEKMDDYVTNLNVGGLGILSENNHSLFKNSADNLSDIPNVSLENGTSLVIIIEDLEDTEKIQFDDNCKSVSDVMLGSARDADGSDTLTSELSVNESCICPPDIGLKVTCENDCKTKLSYGKNDELLTTNCYEEINENLINDIGNWPFVEEEVAEFENKSEFPNEIPEEGRKIELKCSLPWKKIFNISKNIKEKKKKKNKSPRKTSGLELGPAKVEVRLKAPSAEWKVISDYHENSSPVVKVSRLILQRESDNSSSSSSSYSEKDSEEENENKKQTSESNDLKQYTGTSCQSYLTDNISRNENWQPIVVLKRSKELDELTSRLQSRSLSHLSNSQTSSSDESKDGESSEYTDSDTCDSNEGYNCSQTRECPLSTDVFEDHLFSDLPKKYYESKFCETNESDRVPYEKYSPTGCSNSLANEKIYSPSNPHFSPGEVYPDSDVNSDCGGDKVLPQFGNADDAFLDNVAQVTIQATSVENNISETDYSENNDVEENLATDVEHQDKTAIPTQNSVREIEEKSSNEEMLSNVYSSDLNDTPHTPHICNSEEGLGNLTENCKSFAHSASLSALDEVDNTYKLPREFSYDQKKKTKRKMPKNFFVRKKIRRNKNEVVSNHISQSSDTQVFSSETTNTSECSTSSPSHAQSEPQTWNHSLREENEHNSESDSSFRCNDAHLNRGFDLEKSSSTKFNESSLPEKFEEKKALRNCGRGLKRPGEGHSREDTKRRRKKLRSLSNSCRECDITFNNKVELTRHNAYKHSRRRELHHCVLCQRSFSSAARHSLHVQGRSHRHLELMQRHTMHAIHRLLSGRDCPAIPPLTRAELRALQWRPSQPGYTHVYHDDTPLQAVLQEQSSEMSEDTILSEEKIGDD